jgi:L-fuconolactonase
MFELAKCPNIMCKISGMVTEAKWDSWEKPDFQPYLEVVFEAFGFDRLMFGSDWPVCLLAAKYQQTVEMLNDYLASDSARQAVLGGNAERFYLRRQTDSQ